jgi:hypothetical protein
LIRDGYPGFGREDAASLLALPPTFDCVFAERFLNGAKELPASHGFGQNGHRSRCHSPIAQALVIVGSNKDDRPHDAARSQLELQIQPRDPGHAHVQDQTARAIEIVLSQEVINRGEDASGKTVGL